MTADSHIRSLAKALSWRIVATLTTSVIAYLVTGSLDAAALIGGIEFVLKFVIYYLHERAWQVVPNRASTPIDQT
ncbi:MAG: DUF2061 domain-containing protein [Pseudomonadales bacterium]|nr:DUF2061 domain-containing protein [Pseudomonadales bacterium]